MPQWLLKAEPSDYSWHQFVEDGETEWEGIRNHQAAANMRAMQRGERAFFYRSVERPAIVGVVRITQEAFPDPTDPSGRFVRVRLAPERPVSQEVPLAAIKADPRLAAFALVRQPRLSIVPVSDRHWDILCKMAGLEP